MRKILLLCSIISLVSEPVLADNSERSPHLLPCDNTGIMENTSHKNFLCEDINGDGMPELTGITSSKAGFAFRSVWKADGSLMSKSRVSTRNRKGVNKSELVDVCPSTASLTRGQIWKSKQSPHIPRGDRRKNSTALITLRGATPPNSTCLKAYDSSGNKVHKLGAYFPPGSAYAARHYGGSGCGDAKSPATVARIARNNTGSAKIYLKVKTKVCSEVPNPLKCYNSIGC